MILISSFRDRRLSSLSNPTSPQDLPFHSLFNQLTPDARERIFGRGVLEQLNSLSEESDSEMRLSGMTALAQQLESRGREEGAARLYSFVREEASSLGLSEFGTRAESRLQALQGEGPSGLRAEVFTRRLVGEVMEPTSLLAMGVAGGVFRATRLVSLSRLSSSAVPGFWTAGAGARFLSSVAGYALEAPAFALTAHSARIAFGRQEGWGSFDRELVSSFFMLGGLRLAGAASLGLHRQILGRAESAVGFLARPSLGRRLSQTFFHQGGMFAGIVLGQGLEQAAGLAPRRPAGSFLADSLGTLIHFNIAGHLVGRAFGEGFRRWERGLDLQSEALLASRPRFPGPWSLGTGGILGSSEALALPGGGRFLPPRAVENPENSSRHLISMMSAEGEGGGGYDQSGITLLRALRTMKFPDGSPEQVQDSIRRWIEMQPAAIVVAVAESKLKLPRFVMVNERFARTFRWDEGQLTGREVTTVFDPKRSNFTVSRIFSNFAGMMMNAMTGRAVEFFPTPMPIRLGDHPVEGMATPPPDMQFADVIGAGFYRKIGTHNYAFGIFTQIPAELLQARPVPAATVPPPTGSILPVTIGDGGSSAAGATTSRFRPPPLPRIPLARRPSGNILVGVMANLEAAEGNGAGSATAETSAASVEIKAGFMTALAAVRGRMPRQEVTILLPGTPSTAAMEENLPYFMSELWAVHESTELPLGRKIHVRFESEVGPREWTFSRGISAFRKVEKP